MPSSGSHRARASSATSGLLRLAGKRRTSTSRPIPAPVSRAARCARSSGPWPTVSSGMGPAYPDAVEVRTALWRLPAMRSLVGVTGLGFTGYWLPLASLPAYAVAGGAAESTAGVVTAVFLVVTVAVQAAVPALTRRFGAGPVLIAGLLALGLPAPLYAVSNGLAWLSWISAIRGAGFGGSRAFRGAASGVPPSWARGWRSRPAPGRAGARRWGCTASRSPSPT